MLFQKLSQRMKSSSFSKYLKYAVGEVFLLVFGILIALQINNWNERRKLNNQLNAALKLVAMDLKSDIKECQKLYTYYELKLNCIDTIFKKGGINALNNKFEAIRINTNYNSFKINTRGYEKIKDLESNSLLASDSLASNITDFYSDLEQHNSSITNMVISSVNTTLDYYRENCSWYEYFLSGRIDKINAIEVFKDSRARNNLAHYGLIVGGNYVPIFKKFETNAKEHLRLIELRINNEN